MNQDQVENFRQEAFAAHREGKHFEESIAWRKVRLCLPGDGEVLSNLASSEMLSGNLNEALVLFDQALEIDPSLSRAIHNRASLRLRMGADLQALFPDFQLALEYAASSEEFCWHAISLCRCAAFGSDRGALVLFNKIQDQIFTYIDHRAPDQDRAPLKKFFQNLVLGYRDVSKYRMALAQRRWFDAQAFLQSAEKIFRDAGLKNFANGINGTKEDLQLCKQVFAILEDIAIIPAIDVNDALKKSLELQETIESTKLGNAAAMQHRLFCILNAFLTLFRTQLAYLANPTASYLPSDSSAETLMWLTESSFRSIGDDLLGIATFAEKRCRSLSYTAGMKASRAGVDRAKADETAKLALYVHSRLLDLEEVDAGLARAAMGWTQDPLSRVRGDLHEFRAFIERQAHCDLFVSGKPQENIARALLQASMNARSYREVPVRGGRSDILLFECSDQRILIEAKIWRGASYHEQGKLELAEYILGENDDGHLLGAFYVVFDPTESARSVEHEGAPVTIKEVGNIKLETVLVRVKPQQPSRMR
jgi:tetratricopeptide (TPR) repeat protein